MRELIFSTVQTYAKVKRITVRSEGQDAASEDLLWLNKHPQYPGWGVQTPDHYVGTIWTKGVGLVHPNRKLTLQEAKQFARIAVRHGADVEAIQCDPAYQALKQAVDARKAKQQGATEQ
jgi:hypothetical protein